MDAVISPAFLGVNLANFTPEEKKKLEIIHRRVVRARARKEIIGKQQRLQSIIEENLALKRLLLALHTQTERTKANEGLLDQIAVYLRFDGI